MSDKVLNDNQRRHVAAYVSLLLDDAARLMREAGLPEPVREGISAVVASARRMADDLGVSVPRGPDVLARARATAAIWKTRTRELHADNLRGYGPVTPELIDRLGPVLRDLEAHLGELLTVASFEAER